MIKALRASPVLALLWPVFSFAQTGQAVLSCTPPTKNTDQSAITATPLAFKFYKASVASPAQATCSYVWTGLTPGTYTFTATAIDALGRESAMSNPATLPVTVFPNPPTVVLKTVGGPVFADQVTRNSLVLPQTATVVAGIPCDASQAISMNGVTYWRVDVANVTPLGNIDLSQSAAWAQCQ